MPKDLQISTHHKIYRDLYITDANGDRSWEEVGEEYLSKIPVSQRRAISKIMYGDFRISIAEDGTVSITLT